jgi:hypothetical protein
MHVLSFRLAGSVHTEGGFVRSGEMDSQLTDSRDGRNER